MSRIARCFSAVLVLGMAAAPLTAAPPPPTDPPGTPGRIWARVNEVRTLRQLRPLAVSPEMMQIAQQHAEDMARRGYLDHHDLEGRNPLVRARAAGLEGFRLLAENIGESSVRQNRIEAIVAAWLDSPVHRQNLLNPAFNRTGIGVAEGADGRTLFVQLFATF